MPLLFYVNVKNTRNFAKVLEMGGNLFTCEDISTNLCDQMTGKLYLSGSSFLDHHLTVSLARRVRQEVRRPLRKGCQQ